MKYFSLLLLLAVGTKCVSQSTISQDSLMISKIYQEVLANGECYENLRVLCKDVGNRLAGSASAEKAIQWGKALCEKYGFDNVQLMPVEVPHWVRGDVEEASYKFKGKTNKIPVTALGGSVGTGGKITAEVVVVKTFEELEALGKEKIEGKIVFFNRPMDPVLINTGAAYGGAYEIRGSGPSEAAKYGAVACIIRSLSTADDKFPHTGATQYNDSIAKIPGAALSVVDSRALGQALADDPHLKFTLNLSCEVFPRIIQHNVIAEIRGSEFPDEYIVVGGHLDSWDIGEGAHDDGSGIVHSLEVLRTLKAIGYKPKRTIRVVLFINEEFGNDGGKTYASNVQSQNLLHVAAVESDGGGFTPRGFSMQGSDVQFALFESWKKIFEPYNIHLFRRGGSGVDIGPLKNDRIALFGLSVDSQRYFDFHHSANDRFENVNKRELELGAATMTSLVYMLDQSGIPAE